MSSPRTGVPDGGFGLGQHRTVPMRVLCPSRAASAASRSVNGAGGYPGRVAVRAQRS
jgi:hypothetical protein